MSICPMIQKQCIEKECTWWAQFWMKDEKQKPYLDEACVVTRLPTLMIELLGKTNQVAAAVESSRNETVKRQDAALALMMKPKRIQKTLRMESKSVRQLNGINREGLK